MKHHIRCSLAVLIGILSLLGFTVLLTLPTHEALAGPAAQGGAPLLINYQGYLTDSSNQPLNGPVALQVGLYAAAEGGSPLWEETHSNVTVSEGYFSLLLGSVTPLNATHFSAAGRYLQISVDTGGGFAALPRQPLAAVPYALQAVEAQHAQNAQNAWALNGNSGTTPGSHYIGTTDNQPLELKANNARALRLEYASDPTFGVSPNLIGGSSGNSVSAGVSGATIGGGGTSSFNNSVTADYGTVSGGANNTAGRAATVGGGRNNTANGEDATVSGGANNTAVGAATVGGGENNTASRGYATVSGGQTNTASGLHATVGGGYSNTASRGWTTVGGGQTNTASGLHATVGGGVLNTASGFYATVGGGGESNTASGSRATVGGGGHNTASGEYTTVGGGQDNIGSGERATVGGGWSNTASATYASVGGGRNNTAGGEDATVGGGWSNTAGGGAATVGGGESNTASGTAATVPGGISAKASHFGEMAFASGDFAVAGDAQTSLYVLRRESNNAAPTELFLDGSFERLTLAENRVLIFDILIVGAQRSGGNVAGYQITGVIKNINGTTSLVGTPTKTVLAENVITWDAQVVADNAFDALSIRVQGSNGTAIRWVASVRTVEVGR